MSTPGKFNIGSLRLLSPRSAARVGLTDDAAAVESSTKSDGWLLLMSTGTKIRFPTNSAGTSAAFPPNAKRAGAGVAVCCAVVGEFAGEFEWKPKQKPRNIAKMAPKAVSAGRMISLRAPCVLRVQPKHFNYTVTEAERDIL